MDDLIPLMAKSSNEVMLSHIQKLVQVYFDNVGCFFFSFLVFFFFFFFLCSAFGKKDFFFSYVGLEGVLVRL